MAEKLEDMKNLGPVSATWLREAGIGIVFALLLIISTAAADEAPGPDPLAPFEALIGGQWTLGDGYQVLEWGVGQRSVIARAYQRGADGPRLVSEGIWFFHPGKQTVVGYFTAVGMGIELFEYQTTPSAAGLESEIVTWDEKGHESHYVERWLLQGDDRYLWQLLAPGDDGLKPVSEGVFTRQQAGNDVAEGPP